MFKLGKSKKTLLLTFKVFFNYLFFDYLNIELILVVLALFIELTYTKLQLVVFR